MEPLPDPSGPGRLPDDRPNPARAQLAISLHGVERTYRAGGTVVAALRGIDLDVPRGQMLAIVGPSGSGKTTLLNIISALDRPDGGSVVVDGMELKAMSERQRVALRARSIGLVFQEAHLIDGLSALENVAIGSMPQLPRRQLLDESRVALEAVGLAGRLQFPPGRLSGGERQRVAIARALIGNRSILVADEPTGDLDARTTGDLLQLLDDLRRRRDLTIVVATHDSVVAGAADRAIRLVGGQLAA